MVRIHYRISFFNIIVDGKAIDDSSFILDNYQRHSIVALPIEGCERRLPVCGSIQSDSLRHIALSSNYDYIDLGNGEYELLPLFPELPRGYCPQVLMQCERDGILATIYQDYGTHLIIEDESNFISHALQSDVSEITIGYCELGTIVVLHGEKYLAVFLRGSEDFRLLIERHGGKPTFNIDSIDISYHRDDMLQRRVVERYAICGTEYALISRTHEHTIAHKYINELLPCMLIDALIAEDYDYARSLLAPDLAQNVNAIKDFFGEIVSLYSCHGQPIGDKALAILVVENNKKCVKKYTFEYNATQITDIAESES